MILVSSCLLGLNCRYDQSQKPNDEVIKYLVDKSFLPICPEQMGGLSTPRKPCEILSQSPLKIVSDDGEDCTGAFVLGVNEVLKLIKLLPVEEAILKAKSPSCGSRQIYDGSFSKQLIEGQGILSKALKEINITVYNETNFKSR